jgi:hypothetical protein
VLIPAKGTISLEEYFTHIIRGTRNRSEQAALQWLG